MTRHNLAEPLAPFEAQHGNERRTVHTVGLSPREKLQRHPELKKVFDRYLALAEFESTPQGLRVKVPTQFHAQRLEQVRGWIEETLHQPLAEVLVEAPKSPTRNSNQESPLFDWRSQGARGSENPVGHQMPMSLPPERPALDIKEIERSRRHKVPQAILSPSTEVVYKMVRNWVDNVNSGARGQCLWIFGQPGCGKTYLTKQLHEWVTLNKRVVHVDVATFFQEWRHALNNKDPLSFIRKYRKETDLLILENLEDLQGKTQTQQEVLLTISALLDRGASVVVTSSPNPVLLRDMLPPALFSRLFVGLSFEMPSPDRGFKERLWRSLIEQNGLSAWPLDIRVLDRIFSLSLDTPRKVHTFFINVIGRLSLTKQLSLADLQELEALHGPRKRALEKECLNPSELIDRVTQLCGVSLSALQGSSRRTDITTARRFVCLALSRFLGLTNAVISQYLEKDPSTVSHALTALESDLTEKRHLAQQWNWICDELGFSGQAR
jgi:chromosomal replication initiation ATPase DnaA